jgi:Zn-finger nucleic acid-binding protein
MTKSRFRNVILSGFLLAAMARTTAVDGGVPNDAGIAVWRRVVARLAEAKALNVYAIDPDPVYDDRVLAMQGRDVFGRHAIRGFVEVKTASEIRRIAGILTADVSLHDCCAMCFFPRHAIRIFLPDRQRIDLEICYECKQIWIDGTEGHGEVAITGTSKKGLDEILRRAGIELAPSPPPAEPSRPDPSPGR